MPNPPTETSRADGTDAPPGGAARADDARSHTRAAIDGEAAPRLPHERDESSDAASAEPDPRIEQAHADLAAGRRDTDRSGVTEEVYGRTLRGSRGG